MYCRCLLFLKLTFSLSVVSFVEVSTFVSCWRNLYLYQGHEDNPLCFSPKYFLKDFIYLFLEGRVGREKERERNISVWNIHLLSLPRPQLGTWSSTWACALTGNKTYDLSVPGPALNPQSHTSQGRVGHFWVGVLHQKESTLKVTEV